MSVPVFPPASGGGGGGADFTAIMKNTSGSPPASGISLAAIFSGGAGLLKVATDGSVSKAVVGTDYAPPILSQIATAGGAVQDLALGNSVWTLNGDIDGGWDIYGIINTPAASTGTTYYLQPNADTGSNYKSTEIYYSGSQAPGAGDVNNGTIMSGMANAGVIIFEAHIWTVSGKLRRYEILSHRCDLTSGAQLAITNRGYYLATATVFDGTTRIHASAASGIQSGSWVSVTRRLNPYT